jgi:hypothetical protein
MSTTTVTRESDGKGNQLEELGCSPSNLYSPYSQAAVACDRLPPVGKC